MKCLNFGEIFVIGLIYFFNLRNGLIFLNGCEYKKCNMFFKINELFRMLV